MDEVIRQLERQLARIGEPVVVLPFDLVKQLEYYLQNQVKRNQATIKFLEQRASSGGWPNANETLRDDRMVKRLEDSQKILASLLDKQSLDLPLCNCWYAANPSTEHPSDFHCPYCYDTGQVQLGGISLARD